LDKGTQTELTMRVTRIKITDGNYHRIIARSYSTIHQESRCKSSIGSYKKTININSTMTMRESGPTTCDKNKALIINQMNKVVLSKIYTRSLARTRQRERKGGVSQRKRRPRKQRGKLQIMLSLNRLKFWDPEDKERKSHK
jgi:hypothetical protein